MDARKNCKIAKNKFSRAKAGRLGVLDHRPKSDLSGSLVPENWLSPISLNGKPVPSSFAVSLCRSRELKARRAQDGCASAWRRVGKLGDVVVIKHINPFVCKPTLSFLRLHSPGVGLLSIVSPHKPGWPLQRPKVLSRST